MLREPDQVDTDPTPNFQHSLARISGEIDYPGQIVQFFKAVGVQVFKKTPGAHRVLGYLLVMDVFIPVGPDLFGPVAGIGY
jgi:hypothetical protein